MSDNSVTLMLLAAVKIFILYNHFPGNPECFFVSKFAENFLGEFHRLVSIIVSLFYFNQACARSNNVWKNVIKISYFCRALTMCDI